MTDLVGQDCAMDVTEVFLSADQEKYKRGRRDRITKIRVTVLPSRNDTWPLELHIPKLCQNCTWGQTLSKRKKEINKRLSEGDKENKYRQIP